MNTLTVEDLGKRYYIGKAQPKKGKRTFGVGRFRLPVPSFGGSKRGRELWALRHATFSVEPGTILGVIGANGAGKSTLLKILARIVRPTEGRVVGRGRVVSLLELGAGFNPDFTARENIFMNAAMHGIPKAEVQRRLDAIVEFAEVGKFLDSAMRHYSSGMFLRLAFSVAINMEPNILLADEILAVGDIAFQERCLQKVEELGKEGLTVLFVSHDMAAISRLCHRAIWLNAGEVKKYGPAGEVVADYQDVALGRAPAASAAKLDLERQGAHVNRQAEIVSVRIVTSDGRVIGAAPIGEDFYLRVRVNILRRGTVARCTMDLYTKGIYVFRAVQPEDLVARTPGQYDLLVRIPANFLSETLYTLNVAITTREGEKESAVTLPNALSFMVYGTNDTSLYKGGVVTPRLDWTIASRGEDEALSADADAVVDTPAGSHA
jgi:lipopolysaccharide transport system ATP-binding protein